MNVLKIASILRDKWYLFRARNSKYWDENWYLKNNPDLNISRKSSFEHFILCGWREGRDPGPLFSVSAYLNVYSDVQNANVNPLMHFIEKGKREGRLPTPIYIVAEASTEFAPTPIYTVEETTNESVSEPFYYEPVTSDDIELVRMSGLFSSEWYVGAYPDLAELGDPADSSVFIEHYLTCGWRENRSPGPLFPIRQYLSAYPDLQAPMATSLLMHYLKHGQAEARVLPSSLPIASTCELEQKLYKRQQDEYTKREFKERIGNFAEKPLISIVMPVYNPPVVVFKRAIESILAQYYENFEFIAVDDGSGDKRALHYLKELSKLDDRIVAIEMEKNMGISKATNTGLKFAKGQYIVLMDQDDEITPDALFWVVQEINEYPDADFIYSDEAKIDTDGNFLDFFIKPDWSPERLMCFMYIGHLNAIKTALACEICFDSFYDYAQDLDFVLRCTERARCIRHIERVLYLWRAVETSVAADITKITGEKKYIADIGFQAHIAAFKRREIDAAVVKRQDSNRVCIRNRENKLVSIIIAAEEVGQIAKIIDSILVQTDYPLYELVIVSNGFVIAEIKKNYRYRDDFIFVPYHGNINIARQYNAGARAANGDIFVFMSPEITVTEKAWLTLLAEYLTLPEIGGVCGLIFRGANHVHSAGYYAGGYGYFKPRLGGYPEFINTNTYYGSLRMWVQNISVLSKELFAVNKTAYESTGGFDETNTPNMYPVADMSLRLLENGYRNVYTPYSVAYWTPQSHSTENFIPPDNSNEELYIMGRWPKYLVRDPYYSASLRTALETDDMTSFQMFLPKHSGLDTGKDAVLLISHDLNRTGAPMAIYYMAKILQKSGVVPIVVSPLDGDLRTDFTQLDIPVIIDGSLYPHNSAYLYVNHSPFLRLAKCCKMALVNTAELYHVVRGLRNAKVQHIWWVHEGKDGFERASGDVCFVDTLRNTDEFYVASAHCVSFAKIYGQNTKATVLHYGIDDLGGKSRAIRGKDEKIRFSIIGTFDKRKAQNHVIDAFFLLPDEIREKIEIVMVCVVYQREYFNEQMSRIDGLPQFEIYETLPHDEVISIIRESDVLLCPSLDDPMPIVVTEGFMCSKPCVVSDHTGSATLIKHGESGFIVPAGEPDELAKCMVHIVNHPKDLQRIGTEARKIYEKYFRLEVFEKNIKKLFLGEFE